MDSAHTPEELRRLITNLCYEIGQLLSLVNQGMAADKSFVLTKKYRAIKNELRVKNAELQKMKASRLSQQHCYSIVITGDVFHNGEVIKDCPVGYDLMSVIDCNLGDQTKLNKSEGTHRALWNLIAAKLGSMFLHKKFNLHHVVQLR